MPNPAPQRGPQTPMEWAILAIFMFVIAGLITSGVVMDYHPTKLAIPLVLLFWIPLLALHEFGHALASAALGWRVLRVVIGVGLPLKTFRYRGVPVEFHLLPLEGFVQHRPKRLRWPQLESAFIYFAGPGIELLVGIAVIFIVGPESFFRFSEEYSIIVCRSLAIAALSQAILNLLPFPVNGRDGVLYSDGLGIIMSFLKPRSYYAQMLGEPIDDPEANTPPWATKQR